MVANLHGTAQLPHILVIDDQFGRSQLGTRFKQSVGAEIHALYEADRDNLCRNFGLRTRWSPAPDAVARATFCPAQRWNDAKREIENSTPIAIRAVRSGWPSAEGEYWSLVLLDLRFTDGPIGPFGDPERGSLFGLEVLLPALRKEFGEELPIVILSSADKAEFNVPARRLGALDFIQRVPGAGAPPDESRAALARVLDGHGLLPDSSGVVVGGSLGVLTMLRSARRAARSARTILLEGETGSGKGVLARYIHETSERANGPFEIFNASQRTAELQADELFGHWRGAFTDAKADSVGVWERAEGGTLFIDEVADLDATIQSRLMQPLEERRIRRLGHPPRGENAEIDVDVRVILATNRAPETLQSMKADFLNRINAYTISVPPLRSRPEDIPRLTEVLAKRIAPRWSGRIMPEAMAALRAHSWADGNVRELRNVLDRALTNNPEQDIAIHDLFVSPQGPGVPAGQELHDGAQLWCDFAVAIGQDPERQTISDQRRARREFSGILPRAVSDMVIWALRMTEVDGKLNHTAAARLLLGREDISTLEAKQMLRKCLNLDTRGGGVWRRFEDDERRPQSELLDAMIIAAKERHGHRNGGGQQ